MPTDKCQVCGETDCEEDEDSDSGFDPNEDAYYSGCFSDDDF